MKCFLMALLGGVLGFFLVPVIGAAIAYSSGFGVGGAGGLPGGMNAALAGGSYYLAALFPVNLFIALLGGAAGLVCSSPLIRIRPRRAAVTA